MLVGQAHQASRPTSCPQHGNATWNLGRFDPASRDFATPVEVEVREDSFTKADATAFRDDRIRALALDLLEREPHRHTGNEVEAYVCEQAGVGEKTFRAVWGEMKDTGEVVSRNGPHAERGRTVTRPLWEPGRAEGLVLRLDGRKS